MRFSPVSFLLGLGAAWLVPVLTRVIRPLAVEATAAGMAVFDDARRVVAERMETLEDIVAEARARREVLDAEATAEATDEAPEDTPAAPEEPPAEKPVGDLRPGRRAARREPSAARP